MIRATLSAVVLAAAAFFLLPLYVMLVNSVKPLEEIRQHTDELGEGFALTQRGSRLSVLPVTAAQWKLLLSLE